MGKTQEFIYRCMIKENVVYTNSGIYSVLKKKEGNLAIYNNINGPERHCAK